jgi:signal peptidase
MEISPVPHRSRRGLQRQLAVALLVMTPVVLLVLLPAVLGLERYVITDPSMGGSMGRGAVVLAHDVPPDDLQAGDVISFRARGESGDERLTRRIVAIDHGVATTQGDVTGRTDVRTLRLTASTYSRISVSVPWIGYPFAMDGGWVLLGLCAAAAITLTAAAGGVRAPGSTRADRTGLPVG